MEEWKAQSQLPTQKELPAKSAEDKELEELNLLIES